MYEAQFDKIRYKEMKKYFPQALEYFEGGGKMIKKLKQARMQFVEHFDYSPAFPPNMDFAQEEYADLLLKCVEDNFDYTIDKYGTRVPEKMPIPTIIYD